MPGAPSSVQCLLKGACRMCIDETRASGPVPFLAEKVPATVFSPSSQGLGVYRIAA